MKISTKGTYGLESLLDLAIHSTENHVSLRSISERCGISEAYILQIFLLLRRAGIVDSIRGAQGGYVLAKPPSEISVGEVLNILEGSLAPVECIEKNNKKPCDRFENCTTRALWENISDSLNEIANSISLTDLLEDYWNSDYDAPDLEYYL